MVLRMRGTIKGNRIELERDAGLPTGAMVNVEIESGALTTEEKRRLIDGLCGTWSEDPSITSVFEEIARERLSTLARETTFDVAS